MSPFLPIPTKRATALPELPNQLLSYISTHFRDAHPEAFKKDVNALVQMRKDWVEPKSEAHPEVVRGLMRYYAQLAFLATKFPSNINVSIGYHLPFPPPYSLTPDAPISLPSLTFERASVLFNMAAVYASMAAAETRSEATGIKRALGFLTASAGVLEHLLTVILPTLNTELSTVGAAGYDMTESFLTTLRDFVLAEAQECFWQQAVLQGSYKNGLIGKLSMKVSEYYKAALTAANTPNSPSAGFFPQNWISHITVKQHHFEAAAQYRLSQDDLEKSRYGEEIARLRVAEGLTKKGIEAGKKGVAESVISETKNLQSAVKTALERAVRDNDLVYVQPIPPPTQLPPIVGAGMVKISTPVEVSDPVEWLMGRDSGMEALFSGLVPYGVHLALSIYDDRKDTLVRELDGKREELDGVAASTLQSLNLPGSIQALERPVGLPPSLLKKAEEVDAAGGTGRIRHLLAEAQRLSQGNSQALSEALDILDAEATENETLVARQPHLAQSRPPSHIANAHLITTSDQYDATIKQAVGSDNMVQQKWDEWRPLIEILAGGEADIEDHVPSTSGAAGALPQSVRPLRASLEDLDDLIAHRAALVVEARHMAASDDVRPQVLQEATKLAHGGSGDVKPEWFEGVFEKSMSKYDGIKQDMENEIARQDRLIDRIREQNAAFLAQRKDDPRVKEREARLQEMDMAYWKWREIVDNAEEGIKFHRAFGEMLGGFKNACVQFLNSRRADVGQITSGLARTTLGGSDSGRDQYPQQQQSQQYHQQSQQTQQQRYTTSQPASPPHTFSPPPQPFSPPPPQTFSPPPPQPFSPQPAQPFSPQPAQIPSSTSGGLHRVSYMSPPTPSTSSRSAGTSAPSAPSAPSIPSFSLPHPSSSNWTNTSDLLPPPPPAPILRSGGVPTQAKPPPPPSPADTPRRMTRSQAKAPIGDSEKNPYASQSRRQGGGVV